MRSLENEEVKVRQKEEWKRKIYNEIIISIWRVMVNLDKVFY